MKKVIFTAVLLLVFGTPLLICEVPSFQQVGDHCYLLYIEESGENISVVVTEEGTLLFDPPPEPDLSILAEALESMTGGQVRWMIRTGFSYAQPEGLEYFAHDGAVLLEGLRQETATAAASEPSPDPVQETEPSIELQEDRNQFVFAFPEGTEKESANPDILPVESHGFPKFIFKQEVFLYPEDLEIRIQELPQEARTRADIFAYVPEEKVLFVGRLFEPSFYPDIDVSAGGSADKWIDGLKQVIDSVPLLISAIPPEEPEEEEEAAGVATEEEAVQDGSLEKEEEKTLEEMITVVSSRGEVSNLQEMKDMLDVSRKLRSGVLRTVKAGRSCERYLESQSATPYRIYGNFFPFATQLCAELQQENEKGNAKK